MNYPALQTTQRGFTLVELMIGLVLSLMVMVGVLGMFSATKQTFSLQQAVSRVQDEGNSALSLLEQQIRLAGYPEDSLVLQSGVVGTKPGGGIYQEAAATLDFTVTPSDGSSLVFQFLAPYDNFDNCAGDASFSEGDVVTLRIGLIDGWLVCQGASNSAEIIDNVSNLQFLYREVGKKTYQSSIGDARNVIAVRVSFDVSSANTPPRTFATTIPMRNQIH